MAKILLHICCGPCAIRPLQTLADEGFEPLGYFYNPNIHPLGEYLKRREGADQVANLLGVGMVHEDKWDIREWLASEKSGAPAPERCFWCCETRLEATARKAVELGISYFSSSLLYSRYQPHEHIREAGLKIAAAFDLEFVYRDFRIYWQEGIAISRNWNIYRQAWCGCIFSEAERYAKKLSRLANQQHTVWKMSQN